MDELYMCVYIYHIYISNLATELLQVDSTFRTKKATVTQYFHMYCNTNKTYEITVRGI